MCIRDRRRVHGDLFLTSSLSGSLYGGYADLDSSVDLESYGQIEAGFSLGWEPFEEWRVMGDVKWYRIDYHHVPDSMQKCVRETNTIYALGLEVSRFWGCLLYTSPSPRDLSTSRMPSSA
eukprot:TRINITY_DN67151_c0_g1_i2.p1 TRINITY_DN67151_c0_g1~~TRINITY_DN67151_c0_g1_i2.p1  ORF type:complete len:140 (+),score=24.68 TRINITY_DN67151_c0_g1_i2:63-422(+)